MEKNIVYAFNGLYDFAPKMISSAINEIVCSDAEVVFACIGSDLVVGDSLGPLCGTFIKNKNNNAYLYGTLKNPLTAKEIECFGANIRKMHPNSIVVAIDASVGKPEEVGLVKIFDRGIKPGLAVNKNLSLIGDVSIIGVVAEKSNENFNLYNFTRLNLIYRLAESISNGVTEFLKNRRAQKRFVV